LEVDLIPVEEENEIIPPEWILSQGIWCKHIKNESNPY